ncbi:sulfatase-like hydrolase/transferase [Hydrogenimonas sp.]
MSRFALCLALLYTLFDIFLTQRFSLPAVAAGWLALWAGGRWVWQLFLLFRLGEWLFVAYFGRLPGVVDLKLFWLHPFETFEALGGMADFFTLPLAGSGMLALLGLGLPRRKVRPLPLAASALVLALSFKATAPGGSLAKLEAEAPPAPARPAEVSVVLVVGESLGFDADIARRFEALGIEARPIYAAGTATDTSLSLLLNGALDPRNLTPDSRAHLFALARANGYATRFCTAQPDRWLKHLRPYLGEPFAEEFRTGVGENDAWDMALTACLKLPAGRPAFVVLQQIGEHAPYTYYPPPHADGPAANYRRSLDYTFRFYRKIVDWAKRQKRPVIVLGTADHGELRGQGGRWGHNAFDPAVMRVPFWFVSNLQKGRPEMKKVLCHHDLYLFAARLMGYAAAFPSEKIIVWGTMLSGEDGARVISVR